MAICKACDKKVDLLKEQYQYRDESTGRLDRTKIMGYCEKCFEKETNNEVSAKG